MSTLGLLARNGKPVFGIIFGSVVSIVVFVLIYTFFTVQKIEIVGEGLDIEVDEKRFPKYLLFVQEKKIIDDLLSNYPQLATVKIEKRYPHTLVVIPTVRKGIARMYTAVGSYLVDSQGVVLEDGNPSLPLPVVDIPVMSVRIGGHMKDERFLSALAFISACVSLIPIQSVTGIDGAYLSAKTDTTDILLPQLGNMTARAATLQTLLNGFRMKGSLPAIIDLRFDKPVITF